MDDPRAIDADAVLLDLDGVLVDSSAVVERQWTRWAREHGLDPDEVVREAQGRRQIETVRDLAPHLDAAEEAEKLGRWEAEDTDGLRPVPGADRLVRRVADGRWGIVTSGTREIATTRLRFVGLPEPAVFVTAEDVQTGKPDPEAYRRGAELLETAPGRCVVFEDSPAGIRSARRAGATVVAVVTTHSEEELGGADYVVTSPREVRVERVDSQFVFDLGTASS